MIEIIVVWFVHGHDKYFSLFTHTTLVRSIGFLLEGEMLFGFRLQTEHNICKHDVVCTYNL